MSVVLAGGLNAARQPHSAPGNGRLAGSLGKGLAPDRGPLRVQPDATSPPHLRRSSDVTGGRSRARLIRVTFTHAVAPLRHHPRGDARPGAGAMALSHLPAAILALGHPRGPTSAGPVGPSL